MKTTGTLGFEADTRARRNYVVLAILFALMIIIFSVIPVYNGLRGSPKDYGLWYQTGQRILHGDELYRSDGAAFEFIYPPPAAVLLAPLSALGRVPLIVILGLVNTAAWIACLFLSVYLATGRVWRQSPWLYAVPTVCTAPYVSNMYLLGQPNLLLLTCLLGAFALLRQKREWGAGAFIAFAAAIKAFPVLAIFYFIYRRRWKAALSTIVFLVFFLILMPVPLRGFQRNLDDLKTWATGMGFNYQSNSFAQRTGRAYGYKNQSLMGLANRLLRPVTANEIDGRAVTVNVADLSFRQVNAMIVAVALALCWLYVTAMPRRAQRTEPSDAIEYAMLVLLILIFSPLSYQYFFVWLLYPLTLAMSFLLAASPGAHERTWTLVWIVISIILLALALPFPHHWLAEAYGNNFVAALLLLAGFGWKLRRLRSDPSTAPQPA